MNSVGPNLIALARKNTRWLSLTVLCSGFLLIVVDMTIVNVALPSIQRDLGFSPSGLAWVINAYLIPFGGLLLLAGRLGDLVGRKRVYLAGLAIFIGASVLCGLAFDQTMLIVARFIQGICGGLRSAAGAGIGRVAGGRITQALSWHVIFFVNVPLGAIPAFAGWRLPESDRGM